MGFFDRFRKGGQKEAQEQKETNQADNVEVSDERETQEVLEEASPQEKVPSEEIEKDEEIETKDISKETLSEEVNSQEAIEPHRDLEKAEIEEPKLQEEGSAFEEEPSLEGQGPTKKKGLFSRLLSGLDKTRKSILGGVDTVLSGFTKIDEDLFEELEEVLIMADIGVSTTMEITDRLRDRVKKEKVSDPGAVKGLLIEVITEILEEGAEEQYQVKTPAVILVIGVNGVGKTTTIGKLASRFRNHGNKVLLAAADTFRAAAIDQLGIWAERAGIDMIRHEENSDPAAVVFDAVQAAKSRKTDILICDTAGRLHNKKNLMEELKKISKVISREFPEANREVYLVLDATTGQNALQQARLFKETADITGIILTKLDGTAKGGIVIAIKNELQIPVRYVGIGEGIEDLQPFDSGSFAKALFGKEE